VVGGLIGLLAAAAALGTVYIISSVLMPKS
jgi:hypothetical protein